MQLEDEEDIMRLSIRESGVRIFRKNTKHILAIEDNEIQ